MRRAPSREACQARTHCLHVHVRARAPGCCGRLRLAVRGWGRAGAGRGAATPPPGQKACVIARPASYHPQQPPTHPPRAFLHPTHHTPVERHSTKTTAPALAADVSRGAKNKASSSGWATTSSSVVPACKCSSRPQQPRRSSSGALSAAQAAARSSAAPRPAAASGMEGMCVHACACRPADAAEHTHNCMHAGGRGPVCVFLHS